MDKENVIKRRDHLLVTATLRAAEMEASGMIEIPNDEIFGKCEFIETIIDMCDEYIDEEIDTAFIRYVEELMMDRYGVEED